MGNKIEKWYKQGLWDVEKLKHAVAKGVISAETFLAITGKKYK